MAKLRKRDINKFRQQLQDHGLDEQVRQNNLKDYVSFVSTTWLPKDVQIFVSDKCQFIPFRKSVKDETGYVKAMTGYIHEGAEHIIIIRESDAFGGLDGPNIACVIAHEIAHCWLGHVNYGTKEHDPEEEADEQAKAWGVPMW